MWQLQWGSQVFSFWRVSSDSRTPIHQVLESVRPLVWSLVSPLYPLQYENQSQSKPKHWENCQVSILRWQLPSFALYAFKLRHASSKSFVRTTLFTSRHDIPGLFSIHLNPNSSSAWIRSSVSFHGKASSKFKLRDSIWSLFAINKPSLSLFEITSWNSHCSFKLFQIFRQVL